MALGGQPQTRRESMADGIPAVIMGACVFAHDRVDVFVRQFGWYREIKASSSQRDVLALFIFRKKERIHEKSI